MQHFGLIQGFIKRTSGGWVPIALILVLGGFLRFWNGAADTWGNYDDGVYSYIGWRVFEGDMPYRDIDVPNLPLLPYLLAFSFKIFGIGLFQARMWPMTYGCLTILVVYLVSRRIWGSGGGLVSALLIAVNPYAVMIDRWAINESLISFFPLLAISLYLAGIDTKRTLPSFLGGVAAAIGTLAKLPCAFTCLAALSIAIWQSPRRWFTSRCLWVFGLGFLAVLLPVCLLFYSSSPENFVQNTFSGHVLPVTQGYSEKVKVFAESLLQTDVLLAVAGLAGALICFHERTTFGTGLVFLLVALIIPFFFLQIIFSHYFVVSTPILAVLAGGSIVRTWNGGAARAPRSLILSLLAIGLFLSAGMNVNMVMKRSSIVADAAEYIAAVTESDEKIIAGRPSIAFLAQREMAGGGRIIDFSYISRAYGKHPSDRLIEIVELEGTRYVVVTEKLRRYTDFLSYLKTHFKLVAEFIEDTKNVQIYARVQEEASS